MTDRPKLLIWGGVRGTPRAIDINEDKVRGAGSRLIHIKGYIGQIKGKNPLNDKMIHLKAEELAFFINRSAAKASEPFVVSSVIVDLNESERPGLRHIVDSYRLGRSPIVFHDIDELKMEECPDINELVPKLVLKRIPVYSVSEQFKMAEYKSFALEKNAYLTQMALSRYAEYLTQQPTWKKETFVKLIDKKNDKYQYELNLPNPVPPDA